CRPLGAGRGCPAALRCSRARRQSAGRLHLDASDASVERMDDPPPADGKTVSHEAIYRWIYALPKGELAAQGILLQFKRPRRKPRTRVGDRSARIVGMIFRR